VIPAISVTNGTPTTLVPLSAVMLAVLIKDAYEEFYRYLKDKSENERQVEVMDGEGRFGFSKWEDVRVGEIIRLRKEDLIPCDAVVIYTSDQEQRCFVETKGLDGETNLKLKKSFLTSPNYKGRIAEASIRLKYQINCSAPNEYLNDFSGKVTVHEAGRQTEIGLDSSNLVLRGCYLKNVQMAVAAVVFTGMDTKLVLNTVQYEPKKSKLMTEVNKLVFEIFVWQIIIAMVCSLFNTILENSYPEFTKHIPTANFWIMTMTWWLLMTYFIPISLMVTMEMVKLFQGSVLARDEYGYSSIYDCYTSANNTSVN
jgi:magnesium-transporting ATPase (P-type)